MSERWPLVGRDDELAFVGKALGGIHRRGSGVVLAGAPGVGKTRLARDALAAAARQGATVRWVVATHSARAVPLGALSRYLGDTTGEPGRMLSRASRTLASGPGGSRVVIGVDDAHLLDATSALVVHQIVLDAMAPVVITVRTGEPAPDAVTALWKDGYLDRLEMQSLSEAETAGLLEVVLGGAVDRASAQRLWSLTAGTTLFLRHLVDAERTAGRLRRELGIWRWSGDPGVSAALADLVEAQMGDLDPQLGEVVDLLAVGEPLDMAVMDELTSSQSVERAEVRALVTVDAPDLQARLAHPLYGEVRRARIGTVQARRLRGRVATALAGREGRDAQMVLRRAVLASESDLPPDVQLLTAGAQIALALGDADLCERLAHACGESEGGFEARLLWARALSSSGRGTEAATELTALRRRAATDDQRLRVSIPQVVNLFWDLGRVGEAQRAVDEALAAIADPDARRALVSLSADMDFCLGRPAVAVRQAERALDCTRPSSSVVLQSCYALIGALGLLGKTDCVGSIAERGYAAAASTHCTAISKVSLRLQHVNALVDAGYLCEAMNLAELALAESSNAPAPTRLKAIFVSGRVALRCGDLHAAVRALREARAGLGGHGALGMAYACRLTLAQALVASGDTEAAVEVLAEAEDLRHPAYTFLDPELCRVRGWVLAARGQSTEAIMSAYSAANRAVALGEPSFEVLALLTAVRLGDRGCGDRLDCLARSVDGPRAPAAAEYARASAAGDGRSLDHVAATFERIGDKLVAIDAAAHAAEAHGRRGCRGSALASAAHARRLAVECGGARTPALAVVDCPLPLTGRQREIATLVAQGLTNQQIAERLVMSVRTVEGHVYRAGHKLGLSTRDELARAVLGV
ncbi:AAA family ATPase [Rhodococcus spelaei]|uniref:AAA family ATPase n=1 Tax=Rhodococcus spelaei TaxID=2546320 RepID=A0A541BMT2_9NOCA|nr:helix-turn-helix transcriptional regulator [Rhodococcus spelaei]TQF73647.1 AAA family ATPase [Rhodococcus spelaei]